MPKGRTDRNPRNRGDGMADKYQMVSYLTGLLAIIESKEDAAQPRAGILAREYEKVYTELVGMLRKVEDETRNRSESSGRPEEGADSPRG